MRTPDNLNGTCTYVPRLPRDRRRTLHGVSVGILTLETGFERLPGDVAHGDTWPFAVQFAVLDGVTGPQVMAATAGDAETAAPLLERFVDTAARLAALGVDGIVTSCGFLVSFQQALAARCPVPVATSSLLQIPSVTALLPQGQRVGVLTARESALTPAHLRAAHAPADLPVAGLAEDSRFLQNNLSNAPQVSFDEQAHDLLACAERLLARHPEVGALVSECSNFAPYSSLVAERFGLQVFDIVSMTEWFRSGLRPRRY
ncbi:hypothetical protein CUJ91_33540 (plasmid) [Paraburkholderia graminis]|uniref:aspartate/glutamate racemase family protein n=1 Tax=Paraburkholderia graminis TaxID=60548 RepID=UPI000DF01973|nr:aspartate/glutamate racemase family protein [Paraburkholderia graminis]AXF12884.1 hypothetical protein CUJ91_33540 [Paraburkholderia graminis]